MNRQLSMKRSFNCDDLSSIVGLDKHAQVGEDALANSPAKRVKRLRIRTISTDFTPCSGVGCCFEDEEEKSSMPAKPMSSASSGGSLMPKAMAPAARLISPATSHVTVATPELTHAPSDELSSLPCFPSLRTRSESRDFPATAALERFIMKQRNSPVTTLEDNLRLDSFSPSLEDRCYEESHSYAWPKFDQEDSPSPRQVDDFPQHARRVSIPSRKSSSHSVSDSSRHGPCSPSLSDARRKSPLGTYDAASYTDTCHFTSPSVPSRCKLHPNELIPTVNQITEALAKL